MKRLNETRLRFRMLTLLVFLAFALVYAPSAFAQDPPAFPDNLVHTLNGNNPTNTGGTTTGTAGGQIYRGEGTTWVPWGTTCLPGWTAVAGVPPDPTNFYCTSPTSVSPAVDYVISGNWSSLSGAVLNNNLSAAPATSIENYQQCLGCHYHQSAIKGPSYLMSGHKNTLRKVIDGTGNFATWNGPDGNTYNPSDAFYGSGSTYNWATGTVTVGTCDPLSTLLPLGLTALDPSCSYTGYTTSQSLLYLMGGWMFNGGVSNTGNPQLNTVFDSGPVAGFTGQLYPNGNFDCARCHATGYNFVSANSATGSLAATGAPTFAGPEPTIQTSNAGGGTYGGGAYTALTDSQMSRWPTDQTSGDSSWYLTGVQCERCHVALASYKTPGGNVEIAEHQGFGTGNTSQSMTNPPVDLRATALCMECHRQETVSTAGSGTITPTYPPVAVDAGYCSDLSTKSYSVCTAAALQWVYMPTMSHAQGSQFLNSPHAEFTGTVTQNVQNSPDLSVVINGTFGAIVPTPEGGYFMETSGTDDAQNKGCTNCHDPHQTTVVTPSQYAANPALFHSLQGNTVPATNCNNAVCHSTIGTNLLSSVKHPVGPGTPFPNGGTDADVPGACVVCHMQAASPNPTYPALGVAQSHFFRISVDPNYYTFPTAAQYYSGAPGANALNVATDTVTGFTAAIWNDVDVACGQCHGGGTAGQNPYGIAPPNPAPPAFTRTYLANAATGMHASDGLFTTVATPTFSPVAGTYATAQTVTIASTTPSATICYTTNGTVPQAGDPGTCAAPALTYSTPVIVGATETLEAVATLNGDINSAVASAAYKITLAATPTFSPVAGTYAAAQTVTITSTTAGATICYTTDGIPPTAAVAGTCDTIDPTEASVASGGPVSVASTETLNAIATIASGFSNSASGTAAYIINTAVVPTYAPIAGSYATAQTVTIKSTTAAATICYTTNGTIPTATVPGTCDANVGESSLANSGTVSVTASETINSIATLTGGANSGNVAAAYVIPVAVATPTASPAAGSYTTTQSVALSSTTAGTTICYTTNGSVPTAATPGTCDSNGGVELSFASGGHVSVSASETVEALATKVGSTNSTVLSAAYTIAPTAVVKPTASPAAGSATSSSATKSVAPHHGAHKGRGFNGSESLTALSTLLGVDSATLRADLQAGQTLVQIAQTKSIDEATLISDIKTDAQTKLDAAVQSGKITSTQETKALTRLDANVQKMVETPGLFSMKGPQHPGGHGPMMGVDVAKVIGVTPAALRADMQSGQSLVQIAGAQGMTESTLIAAIEAAQKSQLDQQVSAGKLTAAREQTILSHQDAQVTRLVEHTGGFQQGGWKGRHKAAGSSSTNTSTSTSTSTNNSL